MRKKTDREVVCFGSAVDSHAEPSEELNIQTSMEDETVLRASPRIGSPVMEEEQSEDLQRGEFNQKWKLCSGLKGKKQREG